MNVLVLRTAVPFGYLIAGVAFLALVVVGGGLVVAGLRAWPRRWGIAAAGATLLGSLALVAWANLDAEAVEWNPRIADPTTLVGAWRDDRAVLELYADGRYTCQGRACAEVGAAGIWSRTGDFYVSFTPVGRTTIEWRVTERDGRYQFVGGDTHGDPDMWQPRPTFQQDPPAPNEALHLPRAYRKRAAHANIDALASELGR